MKIFFSVISLMLFSLYASSSYGENFKIGVVDIQKIMLESKKGKQSLKELKEEFDEKRKKIESADKELEMLKKEILDKVSIWSNETKEKKEEDFNQKLKKYQRDREEFEEEMGEKNSQVNQRILSEIINIVEYVAKSENYTIILEKETLIYLSPSVDITGRVVEKYDRM